MGFLNMVIDLKHTKKVTGLTKKKKIIIASAVGAVVAICVFVAVIIFSLTSEDYARGRLAVYFFNPSEGRLGTEFRFLPPDGISPQLENALWHFAAPPQDALHSSTWPPGVMRAELITSAYIREGVLVAEFSELYASMSRMEEVIFRSAFTLTMTGLPQVERVLFRVNDEGGMREFFESASSITNSPFISPARRTAEDFVLFFVDESGEGLITTMYNATDVNVHERAQYILRRLIKEQHESGIFPLIPSETRVRDVLIEPASGIYVDLSLEFHRGFTGSPTHARMMLQSITHTMLENAGSGITRRVFFLIESERWEDFHGVSDFNLGFTMDKTMMMSYEVETDEREGDE